MTAESVYELICVWGVADAIYALNYASMQEWVQNLSQESEDAFYFWQRISK